MAERCKENCPVVLAIKANLDLARALPGLYENALDSARKATDNCLGPETTEVEHQEGFLLWKRTVTELRPACGYRFTSEMPELTTNR